MNKKSDVIGIIGLLLTLFTLVFGDNVYQQIKGHTFFQNSPSPTSVFPTNSQVAPTELHVNPTNAVLPHATSAIPPVPSPTDFISNKDWGGEKWSGQPISSVNAQKLGEIRADRVTGWSHSNGSSGAGLSTKISVSDNGIIAYAIEGVGLTAKDFMSAIGAGWNNNKTSANCLDISLDGRHLAFQSEKGINVWNMNLPFPSGDLTVQTISNQQGNCPIALASDGSILASSFDQGIHVNSVSDGSLIKDISDQNKTSSKNSQMVLSPDGNLLATDSINGINVWSIKDGTLLHTIPNNSSPTFSQDGSLLASIANDGTITIWQISNWSIFQTLRDTQSSNITPSSPLFFTSNGDILASGFSKGIILWRVSDGSFIRNVDLSQYYVSDWALTSDGYFLFLASNTSDWATSGETYIRIWGILR